MDLEGQLRTFSNVSTQRSENFEVSEVAPYVLKFTNKTSANSKKQPTLGFTALVHGNEYLGLPILNSIMESLLSGKTKVDYDVYFGLGNIPAAFAQKRFMEEDLIRCFGKQGFASQEATRARQLESAMLNHCDLLLDIHQTVFTSEKPFFIFQYTSQRCLSIMEKWNTDVPVIIQEAQLGENTGLCADEYVRSRGGFGAALELGQLGTFNHFELGCEIGSRVLRNSNLEILGSNRALEPLKFELLKLSPSTFKVEDSSFKLDDGWRNLSYFEKGQRLGTYQHGDILAPVSGYMLFPRYRPLKAGEDLFYYCTDILDKSSSLTRSHISPSTIKPTLSI